jgi:uncharacterized lipoprotein YajG
MKFISVFSILFILFLTCAQLPQQIVLNPQINSAKQDSLSKEKLRIEIEDKRPDMVLGYLKKDSVAVTTRQNLVDLFYKALSDDFKARGIIIADSNNEKAIIVKVELEKFKYIVTPALFLPGIHTQTQIKVTVVNAREEFSRTYNLENDRKNLFMPSAAQNEKLINQMLSDILNNILQDQSLLRFLK